MEVGEDVEQSSRDGYGLCRHDAVAGEALNCVFYSFLFLLKARHNMKRNHSRTGIPVCGLAGEFFLNGSESFEK